MLDRATGDLVLDDGERIGRATTRAELLARPLGRRAAAGDTWTAAGARWSSYAVAGCASEGRAWRLALTFRGEHLFMLGLSADAGDAGWESWSRDAERAKVRDYKAVAKRWLGRPPHAFAWGDVTVELDARSGGAAFTVRYQPAR